MNVTAWFYLRFFQNMQKGCLVNHAFGGYSTSIKLRQTYKTIERQLLFCSKQLGDLNKWGRGGSCESPQNEINRDFSINRRGIFCQF